MKNYGLRVKETKKLKKTVSLTEEKKKQRVEETKKPVTIRPQNA